MTTKEPAHGLGKLILRKHLAGECGCLCPYCKQGDEKGHATPLASWVTRPSADDGIERKRAVTAILKSTQKELYDAIQRERAYQLLKYPSEGERPRTTSGYMIVAEQELDEALLAFCKEANGDVEARRELLQVVATGIAWQEARGKDWRVAELENLYQDTHPFPRWLQMMKGQFEESRRHNPSEDAINLPFVKIIAMGMRALMLYGVVERELA